MRVTDMIVWTPGADGVWRPNNVGRARVRGLEWRAETAGWSWAPSLESTLAYTWMDAVDATGDPITGGKQLVGRPRHRLFAELRWTRSRWTMGAGLEGVSRIPLTAANSKWQPGYTTWHALGRVQVNSTWRLDVELTNLTDTEYEDLRGYATPGREWTMALRWTPGGHGS